VKYGGDTVKYGEKYGRWYEVDGEVWWGEVCIIVVRK